MTAVKGRGGGGSGSRSRSTANIAADQDVVATLLPHWYLIILALVVLIGIIITSIRWDDASTVTAMKYVGIASDNTREDSREVDKRDSQTIQLTTSPTSSKATTLRQRSQDWKVTRSRMIKRIGARRCNFPDFFYKHQKYVKYSLSSAGEYIGYAWRQREKQRLLTGEYKYDKDDDRDPPRAIKRTDLTRKISYIHIGKAGGSSVSCSVREARKYGVGSHCKNTRFNQPQYNETAISHQIDCYSHYNYNGFCFGEGRSYLYNVRNPIHRIRSWYFYEHYLNQPITQTAFKYKKPHCGNIMLGTCYRSFDELASIGLSGPRPSDSGQLRIATNLSTDECSEWAWAIVTGEIPASYHNAFNFDWYFAPMLETQHRESELFVVRVEHLDKDWQTVDRLVGGNGNTLPGDVMPAKGKSKVNVAADMNLPVSDSTLSSLGWRNLCHAMCHEMQIYKMMLKRASNLNDDDVKESIEELREICPEESHEIPRACS